MLSDRFLEKVAGSRKNPKGEGTGQGQDKRWPREAGGAQNLEPRRWDWIHGVLGSHAKCLNKRVWFVSSKTFKELVRELFRYAQTPGRLGVLWWSSGAAVGTR